MNCSKTCPNNYFGRLCTIPCNCSDDQYCDPVKGCIPKNNGTYNGKMIATGLTTVATEVTRGATGITTVATGVPKLCDMVDGCLQTETDTEDENVVTSKTTTGYNTFFINEMKHCEFFLRNFNTAC